MICSRTFHPPPALDDRDDAHAAMAALHSSLLAELADIAMQLARAAGRRALAQADTTDASKGSATSDIDSQGDAD